MSNWKRRNNSNKPISSTSAAKSESFESPATRWDRSDWFATLELNDSMFDAVVALYCVGDVAAFVTTASLIGWQLGRLRRWQSNDVMFSGWVGRLGTGSSGSAGGVKPMGANWVSSSATASATLSVAVPVTLALGGLAGLDFPQSSVHVAMTVRCCVTLFPCKRNQWWV